MLYSRSDGSAPLGSVPPVAVDPRGKKGYIFGVVAGFGILYFCLMSFAVQFDPVKTGLDESWAWALNAVTQTSYIFGRDVVFTYGPLGFLMCPRPIGHNFLWASCFAIFIQAIYAVVLSIIALTAWTKRGFFLFLAGSIVASAFGMWGEYSYRILMGLCLVVASLNSPFAIPACRVSPNQVQHRHHMPVDDGRRDIDHDGYPESLGQDFRALVLGGPGPGLLGLPPVWKRRQFCTVVEPVMGGGQRLRSSDELPGACD